MPFGFGRKKDAEGSAHAAVAVAQAAADARGPRPVRFHGFTEDWQLKGQMTITGRLLDLLNRREAVPVTDVRWAPADGMGPLEPAPGIQSLDPYDLIVVIADPDTLAALTDDERTAHRVHKVTFDVAVEAPPYRVVGTIQLHPGSEPESLLERGTQMFAAVTNPVLQLGGVELDLAGADTVLVNRFYLRGIKQVDRATGQPHQRLPGQGLGGTNWTERS
ncbi:MAG: hypothetical protein HY264_09270 [Chloroflexi bacterium]|nr:hypothetical protein [Chloroflexota bacterium]